MKETIWDSATAHEKTACRPSFLKISQESRY